MNHALCFVPNDDEGRAFLKQFRKYLRQSPNRVILRGRGHRRGRYRSSLPLEFSNRFAVYVEQKPKTVWKEIIDLSAPNGKRNVMVPTKWHPDYEKLSNKA